MRDLPQGMTACNTSVSDAILLLNGAGVREQQKYEAYQAALVAAQRDPSRVGEAYLAWDEWIAVSFPHPDDRAAIPDPRLLGNRWSGAA